MTPNFRAWVKKTKEMHDVKTLNFHSGRLWQVITELPSRKPWEELTEYQPDEIALMQSTGVKDKNGTEIFEEDIIEHRYNSPLSGELVIHRFRVAWDEMYSRFCTSGIGLKHGIDLSSSASSRHLEVIGNIYENPELLEEKGKYHTEPEGTEDYTSNHEEEDDSNITGRDWKPDRDEQNFKEGLDSYLTRSDWD